MPNPINDHRERLCLHLSHELKSKGIIATVGSENSQQPMKLFVFLKDQSRAKDVPREFLGYPVEVAEIEADESICNDSRHSGVPGPHAAFNASIRFVAKQ